MNKIFSKMRLKAQQNLLRCPTVESIRVNCVGRRTCQTDIKDAISTEIPATELTEFVRSHWDDTVSRQDPTVERLKSGLKIGDRSCLAESITLVESRNPTKKAQGEYLLAELMKKAKRRVDKSGPTSLIFRVGITGSPGVGKSSFIETMGKYLIDDHQRKLAVLTVDPSSQTTGGSIMGDKTRMQELSRDPNAFVRSSATRGTLGGLTKGTHESVILCEGAGYDTVFIETVGVGQSESAVAEVVDMVVVLISPAQGDELQGIKRGLMELADIIVVTKSDGNLVPEARITQAEFISATKFMRHRFRAWRPQVLRCSAFTKEGIPEVWDAMQQFWRTIGESGDLIKQRNKQMMNWMWLNIDDVLLDMFKRHPEVIRKVPGLQEDIKQGRITPGLAAEVLLREFLRLNKL